MEKERPKGFEESFAQFFEKPTRDSLAKLLHEQGHGGEQNNLEFKAEMIEPSKLARHVLAIANSGGGAIVFGVEEKGDNSLDAVGLPKLTDKATIYSKIKKYLPNSLLNTLIEIVDFPYDSKSAYSELAGKAFQVVLIEDDPTAIPFVSKADGGENIRDSAIYVRHLTISEEANYEDIQSIISRRIATGITSQIDLREHIDQLRVLYSMIPPTIYRGGGSSLAKIGVALAMAQGVEAVPNPLYPEESFEKFISKRIEEKKLRIIEVLNLKM